jgi:hypothetical protein
VTYSLRKMENMIRVDLLADLNLKTVEKVEEMIKNE